MSRVKVVVADYIEPDLQWEAGEFSRRGLEYSFHQLREAPAGEIVRAAGDADIVIVNYVRMTAEVLAGLRKCRLLIRHGTGFDNIDVAAAARAGIPVCYIPDYCTEEVAEHAIALIFACGRRLGAAGRVFEASQAKSVWDFTSMVPVYRMTGRTVGIVGCGRIGSRVYEKLQGFGFRFLICDPYLTGQRRAELGIGVLPLDHLLAGADFITLHVPLNGETRHLMDGVALARMKSSACLVNTARGGVVDSAALAAALQGGKIGGAAIDVFEHDPPAADHPLFHAPNVLLTPHVAWYSEDAAWNIRRLILLEVDRFLEGQPPRFAATP